MRSAGVGGLLLLVLLSGSALAADEGIRSVAVLDPYFNPTLSQRIRIRIECGAAGVLDGEILDRDGFSIRSIADDLKVDAGATYLDWDGKDEQGRIVPDEAYSLRLELVQGGSRSLYFPAARTSRDLEVKTSSYDPQGGIFAYTLPEPARLHVQAGAATKDPKTGSVEGPALKTVVNREPRPKGSVIDHWNGFDESGSIYLPDLKSFMMSIVATTLPENSILTVGNRTETFLDWAARRGGGSRLPAVHDASAKHHGGLSSLEDTSPGLALSVEGAGWSETEKEWRPSGRRLALTGKVTGPAADAFERQPGILLVFVDEKLVVSRKARPGPFRVELPSKSLSPGSRRVAVNWVSDLGGVALNLVRVQIPRNASTSKEAGR